MIEKVIFISSVTVRQNYLTLTVTKKLFKIIFNNVPEIQVKNKQFRQFSIIDLIDQIIV